MKLRIITATRGESPYFESMIGSIAAANSAAEHIVVAPSSRIHALKVAAPASRVIAETRDGLYAALNQGLEESGDWDAFTWLNDDDRLEPGFATLVSTLAQSDKLEVAFGRVGLIDGTGCRIGALPIARNVRDLGTLFAQGVIAFAQPGTVIRRDLVKRLGGFDETFRIVGDMDFFIRAVAARAAFAFVNAEVATFRLTGGQLSKRSVEVAAETRRARAILSHDKNRRLARWRFQLANWREYTDRVRRHGWVSMRQLYDQTQ